MRLGNGIRSMGKRGTVFPACLLRFISRAVVTQVTYLPKVPCLPYLSLQYMIHYLRKAQTDNEMKGTYPLSIKYLSHTSGNPGSRSNSGWVQILGLHSFFLAFPLHLPK